MPDKRALSIQMEALIEELGGAAPTGPVPSRYATAEQMERLIEAARGIGVAPEQIAEAVGDYLDAHPEATTTVQDASITKAKLASGVIDDTLIDLFVHMGIRYEVRVLIPGAVEQFLPSF